MRVTLIACKAGHWFPAAVTLLTITGTLLVIAVLGLRPDKKPESAEKRPGAFAFPAASLLPVDDTRNGTNRQELDVELTSLAAFPDSTEDFRKATQFWLAKGNMSQASALLARWPDTEDSRSGLLKTVSTKIANRWKILLIEEIMKSGVNGGKDVATETANVGGAQIPPSAPDALAFAIANNVATRCQQEHHDTPTFVVRAFSEHSMKNHPLALVSWCGPRNHYIPYVSAEDAMREAFLERHFTTPLRTITEHFSANWRHADAITRDWISSRLGEASRNVEEILSRDPPAANLSEQLLAALPRALSNTWRYEVRVRLLQNEQLSQILEEDERLRLATAPVGKAVLTKGEVGEIAVSSPLWQRELATLSYDRALGALPEILAFFGVDRAAASIRGALWGPLNRERQAFAAESFPWFQVCTILKIRMPPRQWRGLNHMSMKRLRQLSVHREMIGDVIPAQMVAALREVASTAKSKAGRERMLEVADLYATNRGLLKADP